MLSEKHSIVAIELPLGHLGTRALKIDAKSMFVFQVKLLGKHSNCNLGAPRLPGALGPLYRDKIGVCQFQLRCFRPPVS